MFLWKCYERFASSTELHGFDQVLKYNKLWAAVWLCLTAVACGFCINDVVNLAINYQSEPKLTNLDLKPNLDQNFPNPTLCMEVYVNPGSMMVQMYVTPLQEVADYNLTTIDSDLSAFLNASHNADKLDFDRYEDLNLSDYLRWFSYLMLSYITEAELTYVGYNNTGLNAFVTKYSLVGYENNTGFLEDRIRYIYNSYTSRNVNLANLKRLIGMSICQQRTDIFKKQNATNTTTSNICKPHMITHLSFSIVCSKLLEDETDKLANYQFFSLNGTRISMYSAQGFNDPGPKLGVFKSDYVSFVWHLDFQGRPMLPVASRQDIYSWNALETRAFQVTVAREYQFYSTRDHPCQNDQVQYDCELNHKIKKMEVECGCRLSSLLYGIVDVTLPVCSEILYKKNKTTKNFVSDQANYTEMCKKQRGQHLYNDPCTRQCQTFSFGTEAAVPSVLLFPGQYNPILPQALGVLEFQLNLNQERQVVVERAAKNFYTFVSEFGGTIGAWLGASLMAFIHAALHFILTCYDVGKHLHGRRSTSADMKVSPKE